MLVAPAERGITRRFTPFMKMEKLSCALLILLCISGCSYHSRFSDQELEDRLRSNEAEFNRLVLMLKEDSQLAEVNPKAAYLNSDVEASLPEQRVAEYRALLSKLKVTTVFRREGTNNIYFAAWNKDDFLLGGSNEYFVYAEDVPAEKRYMLESLNDLRRQTDAYAFKRIADRWYLHVDNW